MNADALTQIPNIRSVCTQPEAWPYKRVVFVPTEFEKWGGGGMVFDPKLTDRHADHRPVSVCTQFLSFLMGRHDTPKWLNVPKLEFIDLRHGFDTLYFFQASRQMADKALQKNRAPHLSNVLTLGGMPPEILDTVQSNFSFEDTGQVRQTTSALADLPVHKRLCTHVRLDFNLNEDSTPAQFAEFEEQTFLKIKHMQRECGRINETVIERLSIDPGVGEGDINNFLDYVNDSDSLKLLLANTEELFVPGLDITSQAMARSVFGSLADLLETFPDLDFVVDRLFMTVRPAEVFMYPDRVYVKRLTCGAGATAADVQTFTSHPVESVSTPTIQADSDDEE